MPSETILALLGTAATKAVVEALAKKTIEPTTTALIEWFGTQVRSPHHALTESDKAQLAELLDEDYGACHNWLNFLGSKDKRGILMVGPSGSGKTSLLNAILQRTVRRLRSTSEVDTEFVNLGRMIAIRDTPGQPELAADTWSAVHDYNPRTLVLTMSHGFLSSVGTGNELRRPLEEPLADLVAYLDRCQREEESWLRTFEALVTTPSKRVHAVIVAVNKMDLWASRHSEVLERYSSGPIGEVIDGIARKVGRLGVKAQIAFVSSRFDNFKGRHPPDREFNADASYDSVRMFKALLAANIAVGE